MVGQKHSDVVAPKTGLHQPSTKGDILGQVDPPKVSKTVVTEIGGTELLVVSPNNVNDPEKGAEGYSKDEPQETGPASAATDPGKRGSEESIFKFEETDPAGAATDMAKGGNEESHDKPEETDPAGDATDPAKVGNDESHATDPPKGVTNDSKDEPEETKETDPTGDAAGAATDPVEGGNEESFVLTGGVGFQTPPTTPIKRRITPSQAPATPGTPVGQKKKGGRRVHYEPVDVKTHHVRPFAYTEQGPSIKRPAKQHLPDNSLDPWGDFPSIYEADSDAIHPYKKEMARFPVKVLKDAWADLACDPTAWLQGDHLNFYTWWRQQDTSVYTDPHSAFFPFYLPPGIQPAMYNWFLREKDSKYNSLYIKANWVKAIWRVSHPPSYLMAIERNAQAQGVAPEKIDKFYARHAKRFEDVPMDFNIFSKRVISFICGNGIHWVSYYAFHPGELLCENISRSRSGKNRPASFIGFIDPLGPGEDDTVGEFVTFILEVMLHLEKWITAILEMKPGDPMISPKLVQICDESFARCKTKDSIFAKNKRETHQQFYRQGNGWDCGPCCVLNVTAAYVADTEYHQNWREIRNPTDFFRLVHKPFWNVPPGGKTHKREVAKRLKIFRFNLIALLEKLLPTPFWHATFNSTDFTYLLQLRNGQIANAILWPLFLQNYTEGVTTPEQALIKAMKLPAVPTNRLAIVTAKELEIMKSLDVAEDPGTLIGDELSLPVVEAKKSEKVSPPEVDAKKSDAPLSTDKTDAKNLDQTGKTKDTRHTSLENTDLENEGEQKKKRLKITIKIPNKTEWDESELLEPLEPKQTFSPTKRQQ